MLTFLIVQDFGDELQREIQIIIFCSNKNIWDKRTAGFFNFVTDTPLPRGAKLVSNTIQ
jgi:hypothetical protein